MGVSVRITEWAGTVGHTQTHKGGTMKRLVYFALGLIGFRRVLIVTAMDENGKPCYPLRQTITLYRGDNG